MAYNKVKLSGMGLFDKKKESIADTVAEHAHHDAKERSQNASESHEDLSRSARAASLQRQRTSPPTITSPLASHPNPEYGINDAIALMRTLPQDNPELVTQVVKSTLQSTHIKLTDIIDDANRKEHRIHEWMHTINQEIFSFEQEIVDRKKQLEELELDLLETSRVKERLQLAESQDSPSLSHAPGVAESSGWEKGSTRKEEIARRARKSSGTTEVPASTNEPEE